MNSVHFGTLERLLRRAPYQVTAYHGLNRYNRGKACAEALFPMLRIKYSSHVQYSDLTTAWTK